MMELDVWYYLEMGNITQFTTRLNILSVQKVVLHI